MVPLSVCLSLLLGFCGTPTVKKVTKSPMRWCFYSFVFTIEHTFLIWRLSFWRENKIFRGEVTLEFMLFLGNRGTWVTTAWLKTTQRHSPQREGSRARDLIYHFTYSIPIPGLGAGYHSDAYWLMETNCQYWRSVPCFQGRFQCGFFPSRTNWGVWSLIPALWEKEAGVVSSRTPRLT